MTVKTILRMGNPQLRANNREISSDEFGTTELFELIDDMKETMEAAGGIGIAAPQIGVNKKICLIQVHDEDEEAPTDLIVINPQITIIDHNKQGFWEGCLSVPGLRGFVERPREIAITYFNEHCEKLEINVSDFLATVFQHEIDHLFGKLYVDLIADKSKLAFEKEFQQFWMDENS